MYRTTRLSIIAVMLLSTTALGMIAYNALNPAPVPVPMPALVPPPAAPIAELPPVPTPPPAAPVIVSRQWTCPYDKITLVEREKIRIALGVIPCSTHGATQLVDSAYTTETAAAESAKNDVSTMTDRAGNVFTFKRHNRYYISPRDQTPEEHAVVEAAYANYPDDPARREQYIRATLKKGAPDLDTIPVKPAPAPPQTTRAAAIPAGEGGHHWPKITINGAPVKMMVDTGATIVSLTNADAKQAGVDCNATPARKVTFNTANGPREGNIFTLPEITIEGMILRNVDASCDTKSTHSLLGQSALRHFNTSTQGGWMLLSQP